MTASPGPAGSTIGKRRLPIPVGLLLLFTAILLSAEIGCRIALSAYSLADRPVDIQMPDTLCAKIERVRRYPGPRIIVLGDSLAYGAALGEHGDADWRNHELASEIRAGLIRNQGSSATPPLVMNLGLNGALPADQLRILRLFEGVTLDAVIATTSIRSYATDFAQLATAYSRPWLAEVSTFALPSCRVRKSSDGPIDAWISRQFANVSALYRSRGLIQANLFSGSLRDAIEEIRGAAKVKTPAGGGAPDILSNLGAGLGMDLQTLMLAKTRFQRISFAEPHAQVTATRALIAEAGRRAATAIFIYGTESPRLLPQLLSSSRYAAARGELKALFSERPANVVFLDAVKPAPADYLDYVHVNRAGYALMASEIVKALKP